MRHIIALLIAAALTLPLRGQEWVHLSGQGVQWARAAPSLLPPDLPIVVRSAGLKTIVSKLWLINGQPLSRLAPGGPLIELARILNSQPGVKAIHPRRPLYFGFFPNLQAASLPPEASLVSEVLKTAVVLLPVTSEKRFYRSLNARFERMGDLAPGTRRYRLQADRLDYEAWTRAVLEGKIDPSEVSPEGFARRGDDILYCKGNGTFVAMTSSAAIAARLSSTAETQTWIPLAAPRTQPPEETLDLPRGPAASETFLQSTADIAVIFRFAGPGALPPEFFRGLLPLLGRRLGGSGSPAVPGTGRGGTLGELLQSLDRLLLGPPQSLVAVEASLTLTGRHFEFALRTRTRRPLDVSVSDAPPASLLEWIPEEAAAAGWSNPSAGEALRDAWLGVLRSVTSAYIGAPAALRSGVVPTPSPPSGGHSAYALRLDGHPGFSFAEFFPRAVGRMEEEGIREFIKSSTFLWRTLKKHGPNRQLHFAETRFWKDHEVFLFRFAPRDVALTWQEESTLDATLKRLLMHEHPVLATRIDGTLIVLCSEHPLQALETIVASRNRRRAHPGGAKTSHAPPHIDARGFLRPSQLQRLVLGRPSTSSSGEGERLELVIGHDALGRRLHIRGRAAFLKEVEDMQRFAARERSRTTTRRHMIILSRALHRLRRVDAALWQRAVLEDLFRPRANEPAILPSFYHFALRDGWGHPFVLERKNNGTLILKSWGDDGQPGGRDLAADIVIRIQ